jgi:trans-aconitate 2-methyltransferase
MWHSGEYLKFTEERARPFADLLAQVPQGPYRFIVDLGCGPGNVTRTLADRWPAALVLGIDRSVEMLEAATKLAMPGRMEFALGDLATWDTPRPIDLLVSNAAMQWVGDHPALLRRLTSMLAKDGVLAVQMPNRFETMTQGAIEEAAADPRWASKLKGVGLHRESVLPLSTYIYLLRDLGFRVNAWETTYFHILYGENPVLNWFKGTALRPLLAKLDAKEEIEFTQKLAALLSKVYPARGDITLFGMPRLFFVATR